MYRFVLVFLAAAVLAPRALGDVTLEVLDFRERLVRVTYDIEDAKTGSELFLLPDDGFVHAGPLDAFRVESVFDPDTGEALEYLIRQVGEERAPQVQIQYKKPVSAGKAQRLSATVHLVLPENNFEQTPDGKTMVSYGTAHPYVFSVPAGYYIAYANHPVWIYEKGLTLVAQQRDAKPRMVSIHIRPMR